MTYEKIMKMELHELLKWLEQNFFIQVPAMIDTVDDMDKAAKDMLRLSANMQYLYALLSYAKISVRESKRSGNKAEYEDMIDRKEVISNIVEAVKHNYNAISRAVTIKIENNQELRMNTTGQIRNRYAG